ncbi:MAG: diguanylate cyclase [Leptolyngbyaceae bacterium]|nr:diguanylate cyclase [Leptolyngbyaceae bacterium]
MDASILIVGDDDFCNSIRYQIKSIEPSTIEATPTTEEALQIVQAQQPDVLILQAELSDVLDLCQSIKQKSGLAWIYTLIVGVAIHSLQNDVNVYTHLTAEALECGADACMWLTSETHSLTSRQLDTHQVNLCQESERRLLVAQLLTGLRRVRSYREIARTNDLLSAIALSDPLTELNNRRALEWELPRQLKHARDRDLPISILMLDVDYFKRINDTHGHLIGDRALQLISARLRHNLRFYDTPFRYGGEEFVIILNNTGWQDAKMIGERLCDLIANQPFAVGEHLDLNITISAGTASLRESDDEKGISLLRRADQYLLRAKSQGRNQVLSAEEDRKHSHHNLQPS